MKKPLQISPHVLAAMPDKTIESVEDFVRNIVADQAIEGYTCSPGDVARLTEKVRRDYADDIAQFGGIVHRTMRGRQLQGGLPRGVDSAPPPSHTDK